MFNFWLKNLGYKTVIYLIPFAMFLNLKQILSKVTKLFRRINLCWTFLVMIKDFHICPSYQNSIDILRDQDLLSPHQILSNYELSCSDKYTFSSGMKAFWTVLPVINSISQIDSRKKARSISSFGFSTLHTSINHIKLIFILRKLINFCFKGGSGNYIAITEFETRWVDDKISYRFVFDKASNK